MSDKVNFEKQCNEAKFWINEIAAVLKRPEQRESAFKALISVLHTLRDRTTLEEVFQLSAQLPVLIRGYYLEGYKPAGKPLKMSLDEFLKSIKKKMGAKSEVSPIEAFRAVLIVLYDKISPGEMNDIKGLMPKDIRKLWDELMATETEIE